MSGPNAHLMVPGLRRNMVTICAMTATIMQALDLSLIHICECIRDRIRCPAPMPI